jgi:hypothetical protein
VTEAEWLSGDDPLAMVLHLRDACDWRGAGLGQPPPPVAEEWCRSPGDRKLRLFACACFDCLRDHLFELSRELLACSERYARGLAPRRALDDLRDRVEGRGRRESPWYAVTACTAGDAWSAATGAARFLAPGWLGALLEAFSARPYEGLLARLVRQIERSLCPARRAPGDLLREAFGNPFRPVDRSPAWWRDGTARSIAGVIDRDGDFSLTPLLADALEEAGCDNLDVLGHLRRPDGHGPVCWAVELVHGQGGLHLADLPPRGERAGVPGGLLPRAADEGTAPTAVGP